MIIKINKADLTKGQAHPPGYYKCICLGIEPKTAKDGQSMNYVPQLQLEGSQEILDKHNFNSKNLAAGLTGQFIAACKGIPYMKYLESIPEGGEIELDTEAYNGAKLQIKLENGSYNGRITDEIKGFLPYDAAVPY